jgi:hypothetical protein
MSYRAGRGVGVSVIMGRKVRLRGVTVVQVKSGLIVKAVYYLDTLTLMRQLGGQLDLPGGTSLRPITAD